MSAQLALDLALAAGLLWLAWRAVTTRDLLKSVILFTVFGLLLAIAWARLGAPDLALAEAAIGAGLTGALLLVALDRLRRAGAAPVVLPGDREPGPAARGLLALAVAALAVAVSWSAASLPEASAGLRDLVAGRIHESGVSHPVTAVLLNFRGYDTLLEVGVVVLAVLAVRAFVPLGAAQAPAPEGPVDGLARLLVPLLVVVAGYLLWRGATAPGGAFQAGALLGAAGVLLALSSLGSGALLEGLRGRLLLVLGFGVFLAVGAAVMGFGGAYLEYPRDAAKALILLIEATAALSIGAALVALFRANRSGLPREPR